MMSTAQGKWRGWLWLGACSGAGLVVLLAAGAAERWWGWNGVSVGIAGNIGTGLGLAGLLFLLERRFSGQVAQVDARLGQIQAAVDAVNERRDIPLTEAAQATAQERTSYLDRHRAVVHQLDEDVSEVTVGRALASLVELGGIVARQLTVRTGPSFKNSRLSFSLDENGVSVRPLAADAADAPLEPPVPWIDHGGDGLFVAEELRARLHALHGVDLGDDFEWWALALGALRDGLLLGIERREENQQAIAEVGPGGWLVTEAGVELKGHGVVRGLDELAADWIQLRAGGELQGPFPSGVNSRELGEMVRLASLHLPVSRLDVPRPSSSPELRSTEDVS